MRVRFVHPAIGEATTSIPEGRDVVLGRPGADADIELTWDTRVSRRHACLWRADGKLWFLDLDSHNGSWRGRERLVGPVQVDMHMSILIGETVLERVPPTQRAPLQLDFVDKGAGLEPDPTPAVASPSQPEMPTADLASIANEPTQALRPVVAPTPPPPAPKQVAVHTPIRLDGRRVVGFVDRPALDRLWREGLSRGGLFVAADPSTELGREVSIHIDTPAGVISAPGVVVSVLSEEQAQSAGMVPGVGVDVRWPRAHRDAVEAYLSGAREALDFAAPEADGDAAGMMREVQRLMRGYEANSYYSALDLESTVKADRIEARMQELADLMSRAQDTVAPPQQARLRIARAALRRIRRVLLNPTARLEHDFRIGVVDAKRRIAEASHGGPDVQTLRRTYNAVCAEQVAEAARLTREAYARAQEGELDAAARLARQAYQLNPFFIELEAVIAGWDRSGRTNEPPTDPWGRR